MTEVKKEWREFVHNLMALKMNQTKAYMDVYPDSSEAAARSSASELLTNPNIISLIQEYSDKACAVAGLTTEYVIRGLMTEAEYVGEGSSHGARVKSFETLGKYKDLSLWKETVTNINVEMTPEEWLTQLN